MIRNWIFPLLFFFLFIFVRPIFSASGVVDDFREANQLYRDGKYDEAAKAYEGIAKSKGSFEVYYNLGNAYFKSKKPGLAILNYERARHLKPRDPDVRSNLAYANRLIEYKIEDKRNWYVRKIDSFLHLVTFQECWVSVLGAYFIFVVGLLISLIRRKQPMFGRSGALGLVFVIFCSFPLFLKYGEYGAGRPGIVTEAQVEVRYGPSSSDRIAFRLVEGLEVSLHDEKQDWYRIQLKDGRSGWASQSQVTPI